MGSNIDPLLYGGTVLHLPTRRIRDVHVRGVQYLQPGEKTISIVCLYCTGDHLRN